MFSNNIPMFLAVSAIGGFLIMYKASQQSVRLVEARAEKYKVDASEEIKAELSLNKRLVISLFSSIAGLLLGVAIATQPEGNGRFMSFIAASIIIAICSIGALSISFYRVARRLDDRIDS